MLVRKIYYRELVNNASKIFIVLGCILPITELFKLLDQAASGKIPVITLVTMTLYGTIASFPMILTIATFLTVVITINRFCKDREYDVWASSGLSPFFWLKTTMLFCLPLALICAISATTITPWATAKSQDYTNYLSRRETSMFLSPGIFREDDSGQKVFYIEHYTLVPSMAKQIFLQYNDNSKIYNITADTGRFSDTGGLLSVILENGHRYQINNDSDMNIVVNFKKFIATLKQEYTPLDKAKLQANNTPLLQLMRERSSGGEKAELAWRLSIPLMMIAMTMLVVPISIQTGRVQGNLIFILPPAIYGFYQNIVLTCNSYIGNGAPIIYVFLIHIFVMVMAILLTYIKSFPKGYFRSKNK